MTQSLPSTAVESVGAQTAVEGVVAGTSLEESSCPRSDASRLPDRRDARIVADNEVVAGSPDDVLDVGRDAVPATGRGIKVAGAPVVGNAVVGARLVERALNRLTVLEVGVTVVRVVGIAGVSPDGDVERLGPGRVVDGVVPKPAAEDVGAAATDQDVGERDRR